MESNVSIFLNHFVWAPYFEEGGRQLGLGLEEIGDELMLMEAFPRPSFAENSLAWRGRLIHRLMQQLPWQTHGSALWVDGDPVLRHRQWGGPGFELRVPANRLDEVMRVLMPLVRQLRAQVMVPSRRFWFTYWNSVSPGAETQLQDWDPAWQTPPMKDKARHSLVISGLKSRLEPLGFVLEDGPEESFRFTRPLRPGGGYQMIRAGGVPFRLKLTVTSARHHRLRQQRGVAQENATLNGHLPEGVVVLQEMERVSSYPFDTIAHEEDAAWYFEEFERLFLPALENLHTARDLYDWYWEERWKPYNSDQGGMYSIYAARYLPDAGFLPIVDQFLVAVPKGGMHDFAQFMRTQPMFSDELL